MYLSSDLYNDLLVGAFWYSDITDNSGAVFLLLMNEDGTIKSERRYSNSKGPIPDSLAIRSRYGRGVCGLGDFNGDYKYDIAVCAPTSLIPGTQNSREGRIDLLFLDGSSHASTEEFKRETITIYPNPSTGLVHLDGDLEIKTVTITNGYGQEAYKIQGTNLTQIQLPDFTKGIYFLEAESSSVIYTSKLIIR